MDRILVTEKISPEGLAALQQDGARVEVKLDLDKAALLETLPEYDALVVRSATKVTAEVIAAGTNLRVIGRAGSGVDNIDVDAATERGIIVVNAPASNNVAVAELTLGLMLALARQIPSAHASMQAGKWERSKYMGWEVRYKTLGLVGLGRIGSEVARRARGLEMNVIAFDPVVSFDRAAQLGVEFVMLDELLSRSDVVSIHVPLVDGTRNLFGADTLAKMKPGAYLINASRGGIVDEVALAAALDAGQLAGAALDVFSKEPPPSEHPLIGHPKVITTPHLAHPPTKPKPKLARMWLRGCWRHWRVARRAMPSMRRLLRRKNGTYCNPISNSPPSSVCSRSSWLRSRFAAMISSIMANWPASIRRRCALLCCKAY